ncbi:MAG: hypothetical protein IT564_05575 [Rhodospirillales bacterium]|nr:hypothetical protein [Rhodospirillales bacterium]
MGTDLATQYELALACLDDALGRCRTEDVRAAEVRSALDLLEAGHEFTWPFDEFWKALGMPDPRDRRHRAEVALTGIRLCLDGRPALMRALALL